MSEFREIRLWGEGNATTGGEYLDSGNNTVRINLITPEHAGYASLLAVLEPAAAALGVTAEEVFLAIQALDPVPEPEE